MRKLIAIAAIAVALTLAGCSAAPAAHQASKIADTKPAASAPSTTAAAAPAAIAATPTPAATDSPYGKYTQDEFYILSVKPPIHGSTTDESLIAAGHLVCKQLSSGTPRAKAWVVAGAHGNADAEWNNSQIVTYAIQVYCPKLG